MYSLHHKQSYLYFGSTAAKHWFPDFRKPKDVDVLSKSGDSNKTYQRYWYGDSSRFILDNNIDSVYVIPQFLYTIKAAHFKFDAHWSKTASDILFFQKKGLKLDEQLYNLLLKDFTTFYGKRWATLQGKDSKTFFQDAVPRKYVHDSIHEAVAYYDQPLYFRILKSTEGVACSREKFNALPFEDRLKLAKEEIFVTALERFLIPQDFKYSKQLAYHQSLKKFITTMSSGWMSKFLIENYHLLCINHDDYVEKFKHNKHKLKLC